MPVSHNGVSLTVMLQDLLDAWPVDVTRVALVGHALGGLVIRAACSVSTRHARPWVDRLSDVVALGTHLDHRATGVGDPERGLPELPALPHVRYRLVSAAAGSRSPLGRILGDLLVRRGSASGPSTSSSPRMLRLFPDADLLQVASDRSGLLNHPEVYRAMRHWLA